MKQRVQALACLLVLLLCCGTLLAQSDRATITGTVKDATSAVLPGVQVRITNTGTNDTQITTTDSLGNYRAGNLPIGDYMVTFSRDGFKSFERKGLRLLTSQVAEIDATLQVGSAAQVVEVTAATPVLQTEDAVVSTNLTNEAVAELPMNVQGSRNLSNFMFNYVPGVEGSDYSSHINGSMAMTKEVMIDGVSAVSQLGGYISESQPPMEAIQEFEVDTAGISADAGHSGGGVFRYEMKSGTNKYHGSLFGFLHSTALDALSAESRLLASTTAYPDYRAAYLKKSDSMSDWGGSFGGALIKDKLFYYVSFERYMQSMWSTGAPSRTVPTDAMLGLDASGNTVAYADLSALLTTSAVLGTDSCSNTVYQGSVFNPSTGCVYVNNQIPTTSMSSVSQKIAQLYHKYYTPQNNLPTNDPGPANQPDPWFHNTQTAFKIDYNINSRHRLYGSFYYDNYPRVNADQGGVWSVTAAYGGPMANSYWHNTTAPSLRIGETWTINSHMLNVVHAAFNRFRNPSIAVSQKDKWDSELGLFNGAGNFPLITFSTGWYTNGGSYQRGWSFSNLGSQFNDFYAGNTFIYNDELDYTHGRHSWKFGAEFRAQQMNEHPDNQTFNNITFDPTSTSGYYSYNNTGSAFASFLLGDVYLATKTAVDPEYGRRKTFSAFATDDIKVSQRLTVDVSLRWDVNGAFHEKYGHWSSFVLEDTNTLTGQPGQYEYLSKGSQTFEKKQYWGNVSPHIGAAYKINDKTVARGNYGVFFVPLNMNQWGGVPYQQTGNPGYYDASTESGFNWDKGYNGVISHSQSPSYTQWGVVSVDPHSRMLGNTQQWNIGVQRELAKNTKVDVSWIQSNSYHLHTGALRTNQPTVANMQSYFASGCSAAEAARPFALSGSGWGGNCMTPYPQAGAGWGNIFSVNSPLGNSDYKSFQVSFTRRTSNGLNFQGSYNWSRTHGDVDQDFGEPWGVGSIQNIYDKAAERKGISDFDVTHIVKGYVMYDLPFGHGKRFGSGTGPVTNAVISGWSLNGNFHYSTGSPLQVHSTNSYPGFASVYVNLAKNCSLHRGSYKLNGYYLNSACFENPTTGQLGTAGNYLSGARNPGLATEDVGVHKAFSFGPEAQYRLALRMEFFNVFNRHQMGSPDTGLSDYDSNGNPLFGKVTAYGSQGGRIGQFGARFTF
ncbi:MAG: carboxypeptidase regulatory-like domain-containing protein [Acidobacteriota bacterium]|nr:carboxypeptidase regulatory-like domain-containing protein [Acidobacteriota bacterium]